jgi:predicted SAM-dependent methyltransferase
LKLHLGCGKRQLNGFLSIDLADFEHIDIQCSIDDLSNFADNTIEEIYVSHAFEYFDRTQGPRVLDEWFRVLSHGGRLYLSVPDLNSLISVYQQTKEIDSILGPLFGRWIIKGQLTPVYHRTVYDDKSLMNVLETSGFIDVKRFDPVKYLGNIDPEFDDHSLAFFPHFDRDGIQISLAYTGRKP